MCVAGPVQVRMPGQPDSYEFSIKTPVTPVRWADYDAVGPVLSTVLCAHHSHYPPSRHTL